jgi:hypothetical protein
MKLPYIEVDENDYYSLPNNILCRILEAGKMAAQYFFSKGTELWTYLF